MLLLLLLLLLFYFYNLMQVKLLRGKTFERVSIISIRGMIDKTRSMRPSMN